jgi:hypothetical protein
MRQANFDTKHHEEVGGTRLVEESMLEGEHARGEGLAKGAQIGSQDLQRSWWLVLKNLFVSSH